MSSSHGLYIYYFWDRSEYKFQLKSWALSIEKNFNDLYSKMESFFCLACINIF